MVPVAVPEPVPASSATIQLGNAWTAFTTTDVEGTEGKCEGTTEMFTESVAHDPKRVSALTCTVRDPTAALTCTARAARVYTVVWREELSSQ